MDWQRVPQAWSSCRETPVAETVIRTSDDAHRCVGRSESARADVGSLSVKHVHCDKTEERSVQIFIPHERSFNLVFWEEEWLVGEGATPSTRNLRGRYSLRTPQP